MPGSDTDTPSGTGAPSAVKILVAGGFGVGKTTLVRSISEIDPLRTEEILTDTGVGVDDLQGIERKTATTVALDFGRITLFPDLVLYLFGTPGQQRFWFMWNDLALGSLGGIVLVDTRRIDLSFAAIDFFEKRGIPFIVAVNCFYGRQAYTAEQVRQALALGPDIHLHAFDARDRDSCRDTLRTLIDHLIERAYRGAAPPAHGPSRS